MDSMREEYNLSHSLTDYSPSYAKKCKTHQVYIDNISDDQMEETHFSRFDRLPYIEGETNCMYLTRVFCLGNIAIPTEYLARGMENVVYKATGVGRWSGKELILRVARYGDTEYDTTHAWTDNSTTVQRKMFGKISNSKLYGQSQCHIPVPELVFHDEVPIGNTYASIQVVEFVNGQTLEAKFSTASKKKRDELIYKFGNTLGYLHWNEQVLHGDFHAANVMESRKVNCEFLTIIDMDRSMDYSHDCEMTDSDLDLCRDYDLTQALSSIFKMITYRFSSVKGHKKRKENLFDIFMNAYNQHFNPVCGYNKNWNDVLHVDENIASDNYMSVIQEGFKWYDDIFNHIVGV
jgi:tRNA A-37 threonylcarbamoyl transferase component Bud32